VGTQLAPATWPTPPARPPRPPKPAKPGKDLPPVRHRRDGSTLLSLLLVLVGLAWLLSTTHVLDVSLEAVAATALVILGGVMVVTARTDWGLSRRSWPVWVGATLIVLLVSSVNGRSIADRLSSLRFGPVTTTPVNWTDAKTTVSGFAGPVAVDLTSLRPGVGTETMRVQNTFGPITVTLPATLGYTIRIDARTSFGPVALPGPAGRRSGGVFTHETTVLGSGTPTLDLNLSNGFGPVTVNTAAAPDQLAPPAPVSPAAPGSSITTSPTSASA